MLISLIKGEDEKVEKKVVLPAKLIIRESAWFLWPEMLTLTLSIYYW
jgi:hypothetical protein